MTASPGDKAANPQQMITELQRNLDEVTAQQVATAEILEVIAGSPSDVQPVFDAIASSALHLFDGYAVSVVVVRGDRIESKAVAGFDEQASQSMIQLFPLPLDRESVTGRVILERAVIHVPDIAIDESDRAKVINRTVNVRALLGAPMQRDGTAIGAITVGRRHPGAFSNKQIMLLRTLADQAVIAIENARLFDEVQAKTRDLTESLQFQTATSDVLKVISRSPDALQPVLDVIVETSRELCGSDASTIFLLRDEKFHVIAFAGTFPPNFEYLRANPQSTDQRGFLLARAAREKRTLHIPNVADDPELSRGAAGVGGPRALLAAPLMRDGQAIGGIVLRQSHLKPFTPRQIQAIETFADQAVIALSNVNLFEQVQQRTRELSASLDDLRAAQDRLVQTEKLASLGQLTAGIAHEIKNPLNFVNNFSALSVELIDELDEALAPAPLDQKIRGDVGELTQMLKSNLEKVVQHGKRADSIVKNMLLHSREGSGEHRSADINALVEESLNLAYHGARAEKSGFTIVLKRDLDPDAGLVELYPQEITRALLNLISNGFYATTQRKSVEGETFEPVLIAATKNHGKTVEIRIRDNGTGIPDEVKEKIFNPFFTTKPSGEGTGLGLSMSHDIIVKQHGGTIDVETESGLFTEFKIVLPRTNQR